MNSIDSFWFYIKEAEKSGRFKHDPHRIFIHPQLHGNDDDKLRWLPAMWDGLFGEKGREMMHKAIDYRYDIYEGIGDDLNQYIAQLVQEKGNNEEETNQTESGSEDDTNAGAGVDSQG